MHDNILRDALNLWSILEVVESSVVEFSYATKVLS
jgi:hypothetical protein